MTKPLRFAALVRVSTEEQEKQGESLNTQRTDNERSVAQIGGEVVEWYGGQEHATPGWEHDEVNRLLRDAQRKKFDAIVVAYIDRWSRDNSESNKGIGIFREHGIRFFVGTTEFDLFNPEHCFMLQVTTAVGEFQAAHQNRKSILNKIERAKRGYAVAGNLPAGRTFDKKTGQWGVDAKFVAMVEEVARRYIAGESMAELAREFNVDHSSLHHTLTRRSGDTWVQKFHSKKLNIHHEEITEVPRLLPDATIRAILHRVQANKTYMHGPSKYQYLLSRMVVCNHCNRPMGCQFANGVRYYRHAPYFPNCLGGMVRADDLEEAVIRQLFECFGNPQAVQRAVDAATPDLDRVRDAQDRRTRIGTELDKLRAGRDRLLRLIVDGKLTETQAAKQLDELGDREAKLTEESDRLLEHLLRAPTAAEVAAVARQLSDWVDEVGNRHTNYRRVAIIREINRAYDAMTFDEKRTLAQMVFGGKRLDGNRMGVYVAKPPRQGRGHARPWDYTLHGHLICKDGYIPMSQKQLDAAFTFGVPPAQKELVGVLASSLEATSQS
jgi:DNA invertase Pin-like site-specific DNA recombinase